MVCEEKPKPYFQDGGYGGHFGILAFLYLLYGLLLHHKFWLNLHSGLRGDVKEK